MPTSLSQFVKNLTASGLMSGRKLAVFQERFPKEDRATTAEELARQLVRSRLLTAYQAQAVYEGRIHGLVLGEYTVLDRLGAGGMGEVFKAQHRRMKRHVAIKVLPAEAVKSPENLRRFYREVQAAARLSHPNIVTAYDASEYGGLHYLVMEYVDGPDLSRLLQQQGPLPVKQAVQYVIQAAQGLQYAHKHGIVHRDIKPANLLVDQEGTVKILDMGLALMRQPLKDVEEDTAEALTGAGTVLGTCDYMAPEQAMEAHAVDERSDIYSLGCTLYRLLTGRVPYTGSTVIKTVIEHCRAPIPSLLEARPDVWPPLEDVFRKMVAKQPEDRYQSMTEVIEALAACSEPAAKAAPGPVKTVVSETRREGDTGDVALQSFLEQLPQEPSSGRHVLTVSRDNPSDTVVTRKQETVYQVRRRRTAKSKRTLVLVTLVGAAVALVSVVAAILAVILS
jgi:serine/threonine protein kinase